MVQVISFMDAALTAWDTDSEGRSRATLHVRIDASSHAPHEQHR